MICDWQYDEAKELGIKPCQCGGAAVIKEIGNSHSKKRCVEMTCSKCHMKRKQCIITSIGIMTFERLKENFINDWNTRPLEDEMIKVAKTAKLDIHILMDAYNFLNDNCDYDPELDATIRDIGKQWDYSLNVPKDTP